MTNSAASSRSRWASRKGDTASMTAMHRKTGSTALTRAEVERIIELRRAGRKPEQIVVEIGRSRAIVYRVLERAADVLAGKCLDTPRSSTRFEVSPAMAASYAEQNRAFLATLRIPAIADSDSGPSRTVVR